MKNNFTTSNQEMKRKKISAENEICQHVQQLRIEYLRPAKLNLINKMTLFGVEKIQ